MTMIVWKMSMERDMMDRWSEVEMEMMKWI
jgi:hypothetical protein